MGRIFVFYFCDEYSVNVFRYNTSLLAGGAMDSDDVVQPVFLCVNRNDVLVDKCNAIQQSYSRARGRIEGGSGFFRVSLNPLLFYDLPQQINADCSNRQLSMMLPLMPLYKQLIEDELQINDNDIIKFVLPMGIGEFAILAYESFIAQLKSSFRGSLKCICILNSDQSHNQSTATLQFVGNLFPTIFVGSDRNNVQQHEFMQIRAAAAIVLNADNFVGFVRNCESVGTIYHTIEELFYSNMAKSFLSVYLLGESVVKMADYYGKFGDEKGINVNDEELTRDFDFFSERLISDENVFNIDPNGDCMKSVLEKMNKMQCFSKKYTQVEKRNLFLKNLLISIVQVSDEYVKKLKFLQEPFCALSCQENYKHCALTPTYVYDEIDIAFSQNNYGDESMKKMRSLCIDFWEVFYRVSRENICRVFSVAEKVRHFLEPDSESLLLNLSDSGKKVLTERYNYVVNCNGYCVLTSPLTGFCFELDNVGFWMEKTKQLLNRNEDVKELSEREIDLQKFIYCYVKMHDKFFSSTFRTYIENSIEDDIRQSVSSNVFKEFPQYRKHIGIDIPD